MTEEEPIKESEFNSSLATMARLDTIKKFIDAATSEEKADLQFLFIKSLWKELDCIMKKEERTEQEETYNQVMEYRKQFYLKEMTQTEFIDKLDRWEIELRRIEQAHGLNILTGKDKRYSLGNSK